MSWGAVARCPSCDGGAHSAGTCRHAPEHMTRPDEWLNAAPIAGSDNLRNTAAVSALCSLPKKVQLPRPTRCTALARSVPGLSISKLALVRNHGHGSHHNVRRGQFAVIWGSEIHGGRSRSPLSPGGRDA